MHHILYVPGLNDDRFPQRYFQSFLPGIWKRFGFDLQVVPMLWRHGRFSEKQRLIISLIDEYAKKNQPVILIGQSAGGAAVLNAYVMRKKSVSHVVNVCGRLRKGQQVFPSLDRAAGGNTAFKESVLLLEREHEKKLTKEDRKKVLTLRPLLDETVPASTVPLAGARNEVLPVVEHSVGGIMAMTVFSKIIRDFLSE